MIVSFVLVSIVVYWLLFRNTESVLIRPTLQKLVFWREYLLLTMLPYLYYLYGDKYQAHYVFRNLDSNKYFFIAAFSAFVFILFFLLTYKIMEPAFRGSLKTINWKINYANLFFLLKLLSLFCAIYLLIVTIVYQAGIVGLLKYSQSELTVLRATLGQGGGFLSFNKIVIKSWIPMISYLYLYLYFSKKTLFRASDRFFMKVSVLLGIGASIWYFEKSVIFFYLFGIVGVYVFAGGRLKKIFTLLLPLVAIGLVSLMYILTYQEKILDFKWLVDILIHRITSQSTGSVMAFHYFETHDYLYLSGISNILASVSGSTFQSPYAVIIDFYVPESVETSGAMSSFVTGEAYGLFGVLGVLLSGVIVGIYYAFFEAMKVSRVLSITLVGIYGLYFSHFHIASSFYGFLWPVGLVYQALPFFVLVFFSTMFRSDVSSKNRHPVKRLRPIIGKF